MDFQQIKRIILITRPIFWPLYPLLFVLGLNSAGGTLTSTAWLEIIVLSFPAALLTYGINDAFDIKSDKKNPRKKNPVEGVAISHIDANAIKKLAPFAIVFLILSSLASGSTQNTIVMILFVLATYFYSAPPIRLKELPPFDSISNGFFYFLAPFALGYSFGGDIGTIGLKSVLLLAGCAAGLHALAAVTDYEPDKKVKNNTIAVWLGQRGASLFALFAFSMNLFFVTWPTAVYLMIMVFSAGALTNLITPKYAKPVMKITIMWGIITTLIYFVEKILV